MDISTYTCVSRELYRVSHKKRNGGFQYIASRKLSIFLRHCIKYLPQKRMILNHSIWLGNFDSMPISGNTVIFEFRSTFATDERRIMSGMAFHCCVVWNAH